jgi:hypothetical protein
MAREWEVLERLTNRRRNEVEVLLATTGRTKTVRLIRDLEGRGHGVAMHESD